MIPASFRTEQCALQRARSEDAIEQLRADAPVKQQPPKAAELMPLSSRQGFNANQRARSAGAIAQLRKEALQFQTDALQREGVARLKSLAEEQKVSFLNLHFGSTDEQEKNRLRRARSSEKLQQLISRVEDLRVQTLHLKDMEKERLSRSLVNEASGTEAEPVLDTSQHLFPEDVRQSAATILKSIVSQDLPPAVAEILAQVEAYGWASIRWRRGITLLHWAAGHGLPDLCKHVIRLGASPFAVDDDFRTPMDHARAAGHNRVFGVLQTSEISLLTDRISRLADAPTKFGQSPTLSPQGLECLELIKSKGWQSITWARGHTLLHAVARKCLPALCAQLLEFGADLNHRNDAGTSAQDYLDIAPQDEDDTKKRIPNHSLPLWMTIYETRTCMQHDVSAKARNTSPEQRNLLGIQKTRSRSPEQQNSLGIQKTRSRSPEQHNLPGIQTRRGNPDHQAFSGVQKSRSKSPEYQGIPGVQKTRSRSPEQQGFPGVQKTRTRSPEHQGFPGAQKTRSRSPEKQTTETILCSRDGLSSAVSMPILKLMPHRKTGPVIRDRASSCASLLGGRREGEFASLGSLGASYCLSDESPQPTARIRSIRFHGSASLESVHFIDTDAPADLHLSTCQSASIQVQCETSSSNATTRSTSLGNFSHLGSRPRHQILPDSKSSSLEDQSKKHDVDEKKMKPCPRRQLSREAVSAAGRVMARVAQIEQRCQASTSRPAVKLSSDVRAVSSHRLDSKLVDRRVGRFFTVQVAGG